jgi:hypothetical protein
LIDDAFKSTERILSDHQDASFKILQIKEKMGALTIYFRENGLPTGTSNRLRGVMKEARNRSLNVCEICGAPARLGRQDVCWSVRCASCAPENWAPAGNLG